MILVCLRLTPLHAICTNIVSFHLFKMLPWLHLGVYYYGENMKVQFVHTNQNGLLLIGIILFKIVYIV